MSSQMRRTRSGALTSTARLACARGQLVLAPFGEPARELLEALIDGIAVDAQVQQARPEVQWQRRAVADRVGERVQPHVALLVLPSPRTPRTCVAVAAVDGRAGKSEQERVAFPAGAARRELSRLARLRAARRPARPPAPGPGRVTMSQAWCRWRPYGDDLLCVGLRAGVWRGARRAGTGHGRQRGDSSDTS